MGEVIRWRWEAGSNRPDVEACIEESIEAAHLALVEVEGLEVVATVASPLRAFKDADAVNCDERNVEAEALGALRERAARQTSVMSSVFLSRWKAVV